ncbi:hypothetical protein [Flavobacterium orientale]|uniref:DUF3592 domain-containing protein n=1 Tax=Flavobacterium orientale TaxID=1756020 RepID=A0A916Y9J9_9FLAO|nr:hypothetical protein [Flavobacterium orientale]GGD36484.1 hypothetical protein GCM10011343_27920 [Flavobacterium orientale]
MTTATSKITQPMAKGCGCLAFVFLEFFVWGIWTTITSYSSTVSLDAEIVGFIQNEEVFMDARENKSQTPIVSYQYKDKVYRDTITYKINTDKEFIEGAPLKVIINPDQPQFTIEESTSTFYFYIFFLFLSSISFVAYRLLKKSATLFKGNTTTEINPIRQTNTDAIPKKTAFIASVEQQAENSVKKSNAQELKEAPPWLAIASAVLLIMIGLGMVYYKYDRTQTSTLLTEKGVKTKGIVTEVFRGATQNTEKKDRYTITYYWEEVPYQYEIQLSLAHYARNEELLLLINPDNPSQAMLMSHETFNQGSYLFGLFLVVMGILIISYQKRKLRTK